MPRSPLYDLHAELGARFVDFAGWEMPLQYQGVLAEHEAVRTRVGVFDVSHLGRFEVSGTGSTELLRRLLCNDVAAVSPERAQYTMALNERGGVEDDIIVWRWEDERYWVLPNGANHERILAAFRDAAPNGVRLESRRDDTALLAVQGPDAPGVFDEVFGEHPGRFRVAELEFAGTTLWAAGTGYTGERGGEVAAPNDVAVAVLRALLAAGAEPVGLGARDTLRLEMGYPLWGQDLDADTSPLEADLGWVVDWEHDFVGRDALLAQREGGVEKRLTAFVMEGRHIPRHGYPLRADGCAGTVASGNFSPSLRQGIGLGYLSPPVPEDVTGVEVSVRGTWAAARVTQLPFVGRP